jgi:rRNA-processing protein FCF1
MYFRHNTQLGPPYYVLIDTNFINFAIQNKLEIISSMMDCLYAKCIPVITDCVMGELEKMGRSHRLALRLVKDERFERLTCTHRGTYADDCLVDRVTQVSTKSNFKRSSLVFSADVKADLTYALLAQMLHRGYLRSRFETQNS